MKRKSSACLACWRKPIQTKLYHLNGGNRNQRFFCPQIEAYLCWREKMPERTEAACVRTVRSTLLIRVGRRKLGRLAAYTDWRVKRSLRAGNWRHFGPRFTINVMKWRPRPKSDARKQQSLGCCCAQSLPSTSSLTRWSRRGNPLVSIACPTTLCHSARSVAFHLSVCRSSLYQSVISSVYSRHGSLSVLCPPHQTLWLLKFVRPSSGKCGQRIGVFIPDFLLPLDAQNPPGTLHFKGK